jgi:bleomycin hydrolase
MNISITGRQGLLLALLLLTATGSLPAQKQKEKEQDSDDAYRFRIEHSIPVTQVKEQHRSGTCWSYATVSFLEAELIRTGRGDYDLSEMYFVRKAYELKAEKYVRMHGKTNFGEGGLAHDVLHIWKASGAVPQSAYEGLVPGDSLPVHGEMDAVLKAYVEQVITNRNGSLTPVWKKGFSGILDAYLGEECTTFEFRGQSFTPRSFADSTGIDPDAYVALGSYTHHPFYEAVILEIPDNWIWGTVINLPLDEMMQVLDHALASGYTVCWDADIGEWGFNREKGLALMPVTEPEDTGGQEPAKWDGHRVAEQEINQEIRQQWFDNYRTTDDHLMHITGMAKDQDGKKYYLVKNSWGTDINQAGYLYASESYLRAKTLFLMMHRDALPPSVTEKLEQ